MANGLTPEEEKEFEELEAEFGEANQASGQGLTPEEEAEFADLDAEFGDSSLEEGSKGPIEKIFTSEAVNPEDEGRTFVHDGVTIRVGQTHYTDPKTGRTKKVPEDKIIPGISPVDSFTAGAIESVPFLKDAAAFARAVFDGGANNFGEHYHRNMEEINNALDAAEQKNPRTFLAGDIVGGVSTMGMGAKLKGAAAIGSAALFGGASGLSRSRDRSTADFLVGASIGGGTSAAFMGASKVASKGLQKFSKKLGLWADETTKDVIDVRKNKKILNTGLEKIYKRQVPDRNPKDIAAAFARDIENLKVRGKPLLDPADDVDELLMKFRNLADDTDEAIGATLKSNNMDVDEDTVQSIYYRIRDSLNLDKMLKSMDPDELADAVSLDQRLRETFFTKPKKLQTFLEEVPVTGANGQPLLSGSGNVIYKKVAKSMPLEAEVPKKVTLEALHNLKRSFGNKANFNSPASSISENTNSLYKKSSGVLADEIAELMPDGEAFRELNKVSRIARLGKELVENTSNNTSKGAMGKLAAAFQMRAIMLMGAGGLGGGPLGAAAGFAIAQISRASQDPSVNAKAALKLRKLSQSLAEGVDLGYLKRLAAASALGTREFGTTLAAVSSEVSLRETPVKRSFEDVVNKSDEMLEILEDTQPEIASQLREALDAGDRVTVGALMDQLAKMPESRGLIEDGMGWDGRVYSEEDKQILIDQLSKDPNISFADRLILKEDVKNNGTIPLAAPPRDEFQEFLDYSKRETDEY